jgi:serine/threonine-protein kinase TNNI3K
MEYMSKGSLYTLLDLGGLKPKGHRPHNKVVAWAWAGPEATRFRIAQEIAAGIDHLHRKEFMHRDVKTENVLLDDGLHAKVSDFGVAKRNGNPSLPGPPQHSFDSHTRGCGTMRYMAPEVLLSAGEYSFPCDVYSFGMLLWELTHDRVVFEHLKNRPLKNYVTSQSHVMDGKRPLLELEPSLAAIGPLITACWRGDPADRPTMEYLAKETCRLFELWKNEDRELEHKTSGSSQASCSTNQPRT